MQPTDTMTNAMDAIKSPVQKAGSLARATRMRRDYGDDFATVADAFSIFASWHEHTVIIDGIPWTPPLIEEAEHA